MNCKNLPKRAYETVVDCRVVVFLILYIIFPRIIKHATLIESTKIVQQYLVNRTKANIFSCFIFIMDMFHEVVQSPLSQFVNWPVI